MPEVLIEIAGGAIIAWTLREVFRDLFQPSGSGSLSAWVGRFLFEVARRWHWLLSIAGPLTIVAVICCWTLLMTVGFGLIYWPNFPDSFQTPSPEAHFPGAIPAVLYFSLVSLTTLAAGTMTAQSAGLRIAAALESLIGIALITASVTWIVMIYPALGRMRSIARWASILSRAEKETKSDPLTVHGSSLLTDLAQKVIRARVDFIHFPLIYYFHADTEGASLAHALSGLLALAERALKEEGSEELRFAGCLLQFALRDMAEVIAGRFAPRADPKDPESVFQAAADYHLQRDQNESDT